MRRPNNLDDYSKCVRERDGIIYVFCVECDDWYQARILSRSEIILRQLLRPHIIDYSLLTCVCGNEDCLAEVDYLMSPHYKRKLLDNVLAHLR